MQPSAEIRWFWRDAVPPGVHEWFFSPEIVGGGRLRVDEYFVTSDKSEVGIKRRDVRPESPLGAIEIKGLVEVIEPGVKLYNGNAGLERWIKWTCSGIDLAAGCSLRVDKTRWLRKFAISEQDSRQNTAR